MRTIYIDENFHAHAKDKTGQYTPLEVDMLDGFCDLFLEGLMVIPEGSTAQTPDGRTVTGFSILPFVDSNILMAYQEAYEEAKAESAAEIEELEDQLSSAYTEESLKTAYEEGVNSV